MTHLKTIVTDNYKPLMAWAEQTGATIAPVGGAPYRFLDPSLAASAKLELFQRGYVP